MKDPIGLKGVVTRRLYSKDGTPLKMFKENALWRFLNKVFKVDWRMPFITGNWTDKPIKNNTIVPAALANVAGLLCGTDVLPFKYLAIGIGTSNATGLGSEIVTGGGEAAEATASLVTTTVANDTAQLVHEWTFTDTFAITEEGVFNAVAAGDILAFQNFAAVNVVSGNKFEVTHQIVMEIPV